MKHSQGWTRIRRIALGASLILACPALAATDCKIVSAQLDGAISLCRESPAGLCALASIGSGLLQGEQRSTYLAVAPGAGLGTGTTRVSSYAADALLTTRDGQLRLRRVGLFDREIRVFTGLERVVGGNGRFAGASGTLFVSGTLATHEIATGFRGRISGRICLE